MQVKSSAPAFRAHDSSAPRNAKRITEAQKVLLALCVIATAGTASAQSNVQLFGIVDNAVSHGSGSISNRTQLVNSGSAPSSFGFRGVEDLGGDMRAGFWLESMILSDSGAGTVTSTNNQASGTPAANAGGQGLTFGRRASVSLGGKWGEIRLGREYQASYWNLTVYDPFGNLGVGSSAVFTAATLAGGGPTQVRVSNSVQYLYSHGFNDNGGRPAPSGFNANAVYFMGENASNVANKDDGSGFGVRLGYKANSFTTAVGYGKTKYAAGDVWQRNIGGAYLFGPATVMAMYASDKYGTVHARGYILGGNYAMGPGLIRASYSRYRTDALGSPSVSKVALGYIYSMSKRTVLYATAATVDNKGTSAMALGGSVTAAGARSRGYDLGIRHSF